MWWILGGLVGLLLLDRKTSSATPSSGAPLSPSAGNPMYRTVQQWPVGILAAGSNPPPYPPPTPPIVNHVNATQQGTKPQGNPLGRVVGQTYTSSIEGWSATPDGAAGMASLSQCWANIQTLGVLTSLDSTTPEGQVQIKRQFNIEPQGPGGRPYFVVVQFRGVWTGGPSCVF